MRTPRERQTVNAIDFVLRKRPRRRIDDHRLAPVILHQPPRVVGICLAEDRLRHGGEGGLVGGDFFVAGEKDGVGMTNASSRSLKAGEFIIHPLAFIICLTGSQPVNRAADVAQIAHRLPGGQPFDDLHQRPLAHAVDEQVGLGVQQDRAADLVAPVVVMGEASQAGFDAAGDHRHALVGFPRPLAIGQGRPIRPPADLSAGAVSVVVADLAVGRVMVEHRVHVAGADGEAEPRAAERSPWLARVPVGLAENRHAKALGLQHPAQQGHGKTGMVHIGVASDKHHVDGVPAARSDLGRRHGQRRRGGR